MKGLSKREIKIVSWLEFNEKYFFTSKDIDQFAENKTQRYNIIKNLIKKGRIIKLNRSKYYLIPIKAVKGKWAEHPFIIIDEICNRRDYFIGGWAAANYWNLTEQIPMKIDVYTTRRQGRYDILNTKIVFHRTTKKRIKKSVKQKIDDYSFRILKKEETEKWLNSK